MNRPVRDARGVLLRGEITLKGRLPWSTNATFLVEVALEGNRALAVYKPERGERPLWDFPPGLWRRELAAYHLSEALGWGVVPLTVAREGPHGPGSLQLFVAADFAQHYFTLIQDPAHHDQLRRICAFDLVANNADRKSGHCLLVEDGGVYAIDNGLCFHAEPKLRTVIWQFARTPMPAAVVDDVRRFAATDLPEPLASLLDQAEQVALRRRANALVAAERFPEDTTGRGLPWPMV